MLSSVFHCKENDGFRVVPVHPGLVTVIMVFMKLGSLFVESSMSCESWVVYGYDPEPVIFVTMKIGQEH